MPRRARPADALVPASPRVPRIRGGLLGRGRVQADEGPSNVGRDIGAQVLAQPRALVILFMPALFHRNLEHDRPHPG